MINIFKESFRTEFEKIDKRNIRKVIFLYSTLPSLGLLITMFLVRPDIVQSTNAVLLMMISFLAFYAVTMLFLFGSLLGYLSLAVLKPNIQEKIIQLTSRFLSTVLSHDKEIRKQVVQGIVSDISDEMKKNPDSEKIAKMQEDLQTAFNHIAKLEEEIKKLKGDKS